jgi:4-hydroxy-3-methylbut-2-en-1-yl diphosphate reductase
VPHRTCDEAAAGTLYSMAAATEAPALPVPKRILLAAPRGYCAGVDRAVQAVE